MSAACPARIAVWIQFKKAGINLALAIAHHFYFQFIPYEILPLSGCFLFFALSKLWWTKYHIECRSPWRGKRFKIQNA